jgi:hypothetical protein
MNIGDRAEQFRFLVRDRDSKFSPALDAVFAGADIRILRTPGAGAAGERDRRALHRDAAPRMPRPPFDHRPAAPPHAGASEPSNTTAVATSGSLSAARPDH